MNSDELLRTVKIRPRAAEDIERHADYLEAKATSDVALRFRSAIMEAVDQIAFMPGSGSPRRVKNVLLSSLRMVSFPISITTLFSIFRQMAV